MNNTMTNNTIVTSAMIDAAVTAFRRPVDEMVVSYGDISLYGEWRDRGGWKAERYYEFFTIWEYDGSYFLIREGDGYIRSGGGLDSVSIRTYDPSKMNEDEGEDENEDGIWYCSDWNEFLNCCVFSCPIPLVPPIDSLPLA